MASFRVRTPAEYMKLLWRRRYSKLKPFVIAIYEIPRIQDLSLLPEVPVSHRRRLLYRLSLIIGLMIGLIPAIAVESRSMMTIRDSKNLSHNVLTGG